MKTCSYCKEEKPVSEFYSNRTDHYCKECRRRNSREYYKSNIDAIRKRHKKYSVDSAEKKREIASRWSQNNSHKRSAIRAKYNAKKLCATVGWANIKEVEKYYLLAAKKTKETGIQYHVDHIIPLQGKYVCGLHVENNLQVITASENASKGNLFLTL